MMPIREIQIAEGQSVKFRPLTFSQVEELFDEQLPDVQDRAAVKARSWKVIFMAAQNANPGLTMEALREQFDSVPGYLAYVAFQSFQREVYNASGFTEARKVPGEAAAGAEQSLISVNSAPA